ncbi:maleylpyruvate isomerase family mycothiol-dependent enzyme [Streptomyces spectabilis]|uniref:Maleylpyruvate isomerase family mycothiol-dependent enzyme n=1 Tax=Streptomyces spectabilis TaxID=68270 RepID=A0A516RJG8_STRST|nr:maleylpyruvate isomerase family mycothiol-dependent enzyme [Streptomyces spectabilis]QDQ15811.1 maleylpyruvate isomerase family mycothiol-dependent enzyme [Streptomyces spectabilis]
MSGAPRPAPHEHAALRSLLGAWLLDACSDQESAAVTAHLEHCAPCTAEVRYLYPATASLAETPPYEDTAPREATAPPLYDGTATAGNPSRPAGDRVTALAFARRPPAPRAVPPHVRPYTDQVATLDAVLRDLTAEEWDTLTVEGWTVGQLVAHLAATDSLLTEALDAGARGPLGLVGDTVPDRTLACTSWAAEQSPRSIHTAWRAQADVLRDVLLGEADLPTAAARPLSLAGDPPLPVAHHTAARAFETWIHTRDIALRTDRRLPPPTARSLSRMSDFGARLLPLAMRLRGTPLGGRVLRLELTGRGGDTWLLTDPGQAPPTGPPDAHLALDALEFCLLTGDRLAPAEAAARTRVSGDAALAEAALAAASAFAGP